MTNLSLEDFHQAAQVSPALQRYLQLLASPPTEDPSALFRRQRNFFWTNAATETILDTSSAENICGYLSQQSDILLSNAFVQFFPPTAALFSLGKLGSSELNLSSDVDILIVSNEYSASALRDFQKYCQERTAEGFSFRLDFDLRPGGRFGPMVPTLDQFIDYYGNYGETWERLAFVRLRPLCGSQKVIDEVMEFRKKFSFRKHLDFNLLEDLRQLRSRIHHEYPQHPGHINLKMGVGGIRDIELFLHALQVIHGGKDPDLQSQSTSQTIDALEKKNILPKSDCRFLRDLYWDLRKLENLSQSYEDQQTHDLLVHPSLTVRFSKTCTDLDDRMQMAHRLVSDLIGRPKEGNSFHIESIPESWRIHAQEILQTPLLSRNKERDERQKQDVLQKFFLILQKQMAPSENAVILFKDFLRAIRAKSDFFALLNHKPDLLEQLAWLLSVSPYLGQILCYRPELLDAFVFRLQETPHTDISSLLAFLSEKRLLAEIIEGSAFLKEHDLESCQKALSQTADEIVQTLAHYFRTELQSQAQILALGKWGTREMGFRSDLDFIFVVQSEIQDQDLKFAKRIISRLTESHRWGSLYPIDMRLRPSGKAGPIVIKENELRAYLQQEAAVWERQAYLRARWLEKPQDCEYQEICRKKGLQTADLTELNRIRLEIVKNARGLDLKYCNGGLVDIELFIQTMMLLQPETKASSRTQEALQYFGFNELAEIYDKLRCSEQMLQLVSLESRSYINEKDESSQHLASLTGFQNIESFIAHHCETLQRSQDLLDRLDPRRTKG